jgi:hypothetical protein
MRGLLATVLITLLPGLVWAACTVQQQTVGGEPVVVLENDLVRVTVAPLRGGQISDLVHKPTGKHLCAEETGLFVDRVWNYDDPGVYQQWAKLPYEFKLSGGGAEAAVELTRRGTGDVAGRMIIHKKFVITDGSAAIRADYRFEVAQEAMTPMRIGMWFHGRPGVRGEKNTFYLPSDGRVQEITYGAGAKGQYWWYQPERGWLAARGESGDGLAVCMEYQRLMLFYQWLYDAMPGLEWALRSFDIKNGETLDTTVWLVPFTGLPNVAGAAPEVVAALDLPAEVPAGTKEIPFKISLNGAKPGDGKLLVFVQGPGEQGGSLLAETPLSLKPTATYSGSLKPAAPGTYVVRAVVELAGKPVLEFEKPCVVGQASAKYALQPLGDRLGREGEKFEDKMATAGNAPPDLKPSEEIVTPHTPWAKPYYQGKTRALILTSYLVGRETIELAQRLDLDYVAPTVGSAYELGYTTGLFPREINLKQSQGYVREALKQDYDVILIGGLANEFFDKDLLDTIFTKVRNGTGLVWVQPNRLPAEYAALLPLTDFKPTNLPQLTWKKTAEHALTAGLPWEALPQTACSVYKPNGELLATAGDRPLLAVREEAKGRIVGLGYNTGWQGPGAYSSGLTPFVRNAPQQFPYWEYHYSLLARSVLWAARREPEITLSVTAAPGQPVNVTVTNPGPARSGALLVRLTDQFGRPEKYSKESLQIKPGQTSASVALPAPLPDGLHLVDVGLSENEQIINWATTSFTVQSPLTLKDLKADREFYQGGDTLTATVALTAAAPERKCELQWSIVDYWSRVIARAVTPVEPGKTDASWTTTLPEPLCHEATLRVELLDDSKPVSARQTKLLLMPARTARRDWNPMTWTLWGNPAGAYSRDSLHRVAADQCRHIGLDTVQVSSTWLQPEENRSNYEEGFRLMPYGIGGGPLRLNDRKGRDGKPGFYDLQEQYVKTRDRQFLQRPVSLEDPEMRATQAKEIAERVKVMAPFKPMGYCLGDELGTTYYVTPFDFDFSPVSLRGFRQWLLLQYSSLAGVNQEWDTKFATWDEVMPMTALEVAQRGNYAPWADHRTYMEVAFTDYMTFVRDEIRKTDPEGRIGISGTQASEAYGGFDWWRLAHTLDFIQAYDHQNTGEMHRSFGIVSLPWWGYAVQNPDISYTMWNRFFNQARGGSYFVYNYMLNPDMTLTKSTGDGVGAIQDQQEGLGLLFQGCTRPPDVLVHYSMASIHAAYACDNDDLFRRNRDGWFRAIDDSGMQADFIAYEEIERGDLLKRGKALLLPYSQALSPKEVAAIKAFVRGGGMVIADARPGVMDEHCRTLAQGALDDVFGVKSSTDGMEKMAQGDFTPQGKLGALPPDFKLDDYCASPALQLTTGKALAQIGGKPAFIVNTYGKGQAVLLNMFLNQYARRQELGAEAGLLKIAQEAFAAAQVSSPLRARITAGRVKVRRFVNGPVQYVGVLAGASGEGKVDLAVPPDCTVYSTTWPQDPKEPVSGRDLGGKRTISVRAGEAAVLAFLPERLTAVKVQPAALKVAPGSVVSYQVTAVGGKQRLPRVFRIEVLDARDKVPFYYAAQLAAPQDVAKGSFQLALNDAPGKWKIIATDVATGMKGEATFAVTP